ncbi:DUF4864 domain-containing protein [Roseovarius aestuarii]|nr:DUF4864 domain-containing protein [Roseovarius aestuarii]
MKHAIATMLTVLSLTWGADAEAQAEPIEAVISAQIKAFKADDFEQAFTYASPMIKRMFGDAQSFGVMVQRGFPMVWRPANVQFLNQEERDGAVWQDVLVRDSTGASHVLQYEMIQIDNGWKINGVRVREPAGLSA